jgi:putative membrane protein
MVRFRSLLPVDSFNCGLLALFLVLWAVSCLNLPYPEYFALQHAPTIVATIVLIAVERKLRIGRPSFALVIAFLMLHLVGGRYLYSNVPYDDWSQRILGFHFSDQMGWERNHYDRFVHFFFGLLFAYPLWQLFELQARMVGWWPGLMAVCVVLAASAIYELGEWATAMILAPDWAEAYNGQQGDVWDPQRDMALAMAGAILGVGLVRIQRQLSASKSSR